MMALLQSWLVRIYCMEMLDIVCWGIVLTMVFLAARDRYQCCRWAKALLVLGFVCTIAIIFYATIVNRSNDHTLSVNLIPLHSYREVWAGGHPELYRSNFMNAALFYPSGLLLTCLLPPKWPGWCKCLLVVIALGVFSAGIEYLQYCYALGQVEIDDVIHNTAGALAGSLAALLISPCIVLATKKIAQMRNREG